MTTKKGRVETRGEERQELLQNYMMYKVHWLHELFKGLTVSQQRYFYLSFQINDASKCTEKSYHIFLTFNSHMYSRDTNLWRPKIWRLSFLSLPAPPPPPSHDPAPNGNDLGHFMKSYMKYILSNSQSSFLCQKESDLIRAKMPQKLYCK